ncbi:uncharacterized protein EHS24_007599 [Apiotrichum porosum]|uniref:Uncharacterized protein n=1 Tax=Apiotrichum porosum TaxID=105984 RepID=A0A427XUT2_9TREE|nr:uncharacterized protein EHS24_007599 [Apiotrichum porosum]RSH82614.1 hypothetical protein EHS24_007599 [Apiotrichum porosum]
MPPKAKAPPKPTNSAAQAAVLSRTTVPKTEPFTAPAPAASGGRTKQTARKSTGSRAPSGRYDFDVDNHEGYTSGYDRWQFNDNHKGDPRGYWGHDRWGKWGWHWHGNYTEGDRM